MPPSDHDSWREPPSCHRADGAGARMALIDSLTFDERQRLEIAVHFAIVGNAYNHLSIGAGRSQGVVET